MSAPPRAPRGGGRSRRGRLPADDGSRPAGALRYGIAPGIAHRQIGGQTVVVGRTGLLYTFAGAGEVVWPVIAGGAPFERAVQALARRYGLAPARARRDALAFLRQLEARGLVHRRPAGRRRAGS